MADLLVEIDASHLMEALSAVEDVLNPDDVLDAAAAIILDHTRQRFLQEVDPQGQAWTPSRAAVIRRGGGYTHGKYTGTGTLFESGTLFHSIQEDNPGGDIRRIIAGAFNDKGVEYGHFHQYGTRYLPKREFMGVNSDDTDLFEQRIMQRLAEALGVG